MLRNENFKEILQQEPFCLVLISGDGCANCSTMTPIVNRMKDKFLDLSVHFVDIDKHNYKINEYYGVEVVPTLLFLYEGALISKVSGYQPEEILEIYIECKMGEYKAQNANTN